MTCELMLAITSGLWYARFFVYVLRTTLVKVKVQAYSLISSISSDFYILPRGHSDLFISLPSHFHREHTALQPFRRIKLIVYMLSLSYQVLIFT